MRTQQENELIAIAENWRKSPDFQCTMFSDNTPFTDIGDGLKARATKVNGAWMFRVIARYNYMGDNFYTLEESIRHAVDEKNEHAAQLREKIKSHL